MGARGIQQRPTGNRIVKWRRRETLAKTIEGFCNALPTPDGGDFRLMRWQREFIRDVFVEDKRGVRPVRTAVLSVARKNGKTGLAVALTLAHLVGPLSVAAGEVYSVASDKENASLVFYGMENILLQCPNLLSQVNIVRNQRRIECANRTVYRALTAESSHQHGLSPLFVVFDELHAAKDRQMFDVIRTSFGARESSLLMITSTQAPDDTSVMSEQFDYGLKVSSGEVEDESFVAHLYTAPKSMPINDPKTWALANPSLGKVRVASELKTLCNQLKYKPQGISAFRNLYLNQRVRVDAEPWITNEQWMACAAEFTADDLQGEKCYLGIDLSSVADLSAVVAYFPDTHSLLLWCWTTERQANRPANAAYRAWALRNLMNVAPGEAIDPEDIYDTVATLCKRYDVRGVGYDRWGMTSAKKKFDKRAIDCEIKPVGQGYVSMSPACNRFESLVLNKQLRHTGNPIFSWAVSNVKMDRDPAGNVKPNKSKAVDKIDPLVAALMAVYIAPVEEKPALDSVDNLIINF